MALEQLPHDSQEIVSDFQVGSNNKKEVPPKKVIGSRICATCDETNIILKGITTSACKFRCFLTVNSWKLFYHLKLFL